MTDRERLIKLLKGTLHIGMSNEASEMIADHLLANGVIVPPCKVGDTVWFNTWEKNATVCVDIRPHKVDRIDVTLVCDERQLIPTEIPDFEIGKRVFLTKEEAEQALKEREQSDR